MKIRASAGFTLLSSQASLQLMSVDANFPVEESTAVANSIGVLYPGERADIIIRRMPKSGDDSTLAVALDQE